MDRSPEYVKTKVARGTTRKEIFNKGVLNYQSDEIEKVILREPTKMILCVLPYHYKRYN